MQAFIPKEDARAFIMPNFIFENQELSCGAKLLFSTLCDYARDKSFCFPSKATLAKRLNVSINTLKTWLRQLISFGYVQIQSTVKKIIFHLFSPTIHSTINKTTQKSGKDKPSNFDSHPSKIDTEVNVNNLKLNLTPPISPNSSKNDAVPKLVRKCVNFSFDDFWTVYPKKENQEKARRAFYSCKKQQKLPTLEFFKQTIEHFLAESKWQREEGRFIPQLHNFINDLRWNEYEPILQKEEIKQEEKPYQAKTYSFEEEIEEQRRQKQREAEKRRQEEEKYKQEKEEIDKYWNSFLTYFVQDGNSNLIFAHRLYSSLYREKNLPNVTCKQNCTALEFIQPYYEKLKSKGVHKRSTVLEKKILIQKKTYKFRRLYGYYTSDFTGKRRCWQINDFIRDISSSRRAGL